MSLFGNRSVAFIPRSRRPGFFGIAVFSRPAGAAAGVGVEAVSADVGWVASAVIAEVYDGGRSQAGVTAVDAASAWIADQRAPAQSAFGAFGPRSRCPIVHVCSQMMRPRHRPDRARRSGGHRATPAWSCGAIASIVVSR